MASCVSLASAREIRGTDGPELSQRFKSQIESNDGRAFPQDVQEQLWHTIVALARKLLIALWKYATAGVVIEGAVMKAA